MPQFRQLTAGLSLPQVSIVMGVLVLTLAGAMAVALAMRWWNVRQARSGFGQT